MNLFIFRIKCNFVLSLVFNFFHLICSLIQGKLLGNIGKSKENIKDIPDEDGFVHLEMDRELEFRRKNRKQANDALTSTLSAFYAKVLVVLGFSFPITDVLTEKAPNKFYQGFYLYLYIGSIVFVAFMYIDHLRSRRSQRFAANNNKGEKFQRKASKLKK